MIIDIKDSTVERLFEINRDKNLNEIIEKLLEDWNFYHL